jgi:hypothetical protein
MPAHPTIDSAEGRTDSITNLAACAGSVTIAVATGAFLDEAFLLPLELFLTVFFDDNFLFMVT